MTDSGPKESILEALRSDEVASYSREEIPSERDRRIMRALEVNVLRSGTFAAEPVEGLGARDSDVLCFFSERMATLAVRTGDKHFIELGLTALLLSMPASDIREVLLILPLHFDAVRRLGLSPDLVFEDVSARVGDPSGLLAGFLRRAPEDQSLAVMGYSTEGHGKTFRYRRDW